MVRGSCLCGGVRFEYARAYSATNISIIRTKPDAYTADAFASCHSAIGTGGFRIGMKRSNIESNMNFSG